MSKRTTSQTLDAAAAAYHRAKRLPATDGSAEALRARAEHRQAAISRLLKAAEARGAELTEGDADAAADR